MEHNLVLGRSTNDVEYEVERVPIHGEVRVVQDNIAYATGRTREPDVIQIQTRHIPKEGQKRTTRLLRFPPESLLKCPLLLERCEALAYICSIGVAFWAVVLCKDAMALCIEDEESADRVEGEVEGHG